MRRKSGNVFNRKSRILHSRRGTRVHREYDGQLPTNLTDRLQKAGEDPDLINIAWPMERKQSVLPRSKS